ncbi:hypothetical protein [Planococcus beijingensis]|uniref:hypothetical protein n=1 Tax=Planococcus beijingensis TaxID=2782551 RepID=UPI00193B4C8C|nr:hypothetical protein [Planococcus beijingensis]
MNQIIEVVNTYGPLIGAGTFLVYILKAAIDFWFVTELEKKLMTDYQKLKGFASKMVITIIPSVFLTTLYAVIFQKDLLVQQANVSEMVFLIMFLAMIFLLNICMNLMVTGIEKVLNLKSEYMILINDEEWSVERLTKNNLLLLNNKKNEYLLIDDWKEKKIKKIINKNTYTYKLYSENTNWQKSIGVSIAVLILSVGTFVFFSDNNYSSVLLFPACLAFLSTLIILGNLVEYKRSYA